MLKNTRFHDQSLFFLGSTGVLSGIFLTNIFGENTIFLLLFVVILSIQILFFFRSFTLYIGVFIFFCSLGGYLSIERLYETDHITKLFQEETVFFTQDTFVKGVLREKISENNKNARYVLRNVTVGKIKFPDKVGILVTFPDSRGKNIDDSIAFTGRLSLPVNNEVFDYRTYLLLDNIYATTSTSFPDKMGVQPSSVLSIFIRDVREKILFLIEEIYPLDSAKLLEGMIIGERANLSPETKKNFNTVGLTHIIAVSGFNITIILIFLSFLFGSLPSSIKILLACVTIGFFTLLVGPQISVLRASVFGLISYIILLSGRKMQAFSLLLAVAVGFVMIDPLLLTSDVSFHLSFLAVLGLLFFGETFNRIFSWMPKWLGLRESLAMCFAAMVFTLPILMINFGQISLISPIANILVVPLIPLIMLVGFLSMIAGLLFPLIGVFFGFPTWLGLTYILNVVSWLGSLSYAAIPVDFGVYKYVFEGVYLMGVVFLVLFFQKSNI